MDLSYLVALPVPEPHLSKLAAVQEELRPPGWHITIGPHVTLVAPGKAVVRQEAAILQFTEARRAFDDLRLDYPALGAFTRRGLSTIFLKPIDSPELYELQRRLLIMASGWQDISRSQRRPFIPHVTLVNRLPEEQTNAIQQKLAPLAPVSMVFSQLCLFAKRAHNQQWLQIA